MPGPRSHGGARRHIRICRGADTDAYGALPSPQNWVWVPLLGDGMKMKATAPRYVPDTNYSEDFRQQIAIHHRQEVAGNITTLPWPEVTQFLLDMALLRVANPLSPTYQDLYQHVVEHHTPEDPRRHYGCVANTLGISATGTGANDVQFTLGLIGQREVEIGWEASDYSGVTPAPFMFAHAELRVDTTLVTDVENWKINVDNKVAEAPFIWANDVKMAVRAYAIAGGLRSVTLDLTKLNNTRNFNRHIRRGTYATFEALFRHPLGHIMQILLPYLAVEESDEDGTPSAKAKEAPKMIALKAPSGPYAGQDIIVSVDLAAGGTTTLAAIPPWTTTPAPATTTTTLP